ncbi:MAG: SMC-Scp complex subunit ScpB [Phycisphaerae bacterium]
MDDNITSVSPIDARPENEFVDDAAPSADAEAGPVLTLAAPPAPIAAAPEQIVEALLFASDTPLSSARLGELAGVSASQIAGLVAALNDKYVAVGLSFRIQPIAKGYQMLTLPAYQPWLARLDKQRAHSRLSDAALETLAIVAYKQPIIRADVEAIRGVACGDALSRLREVGLIKVVGRAEIVGRPMLYGTTRLFLDTFGLADLEDLPAMESLTLRGAAVRSPGGSSRSVAVAGA